MAISLERLSEVLSRGNQRTKNQLFERAVQKRKEATLARELALAPPEEKSNILDRVGNAVVQGGAAFLTTGNPLLAAVSGAAGALKEEKFLPVQSAVSGAAQGSVLKSVVGGETDPLKAIGSLAKPENLGRSALALNSIVDPSSSLDVMNKIGTIENNKVVARKKAAAELEKEERKFDHEINKIKTKSIEDAKNSKQDFSPSDVLNLYKKIGGDSFSNKKLDKTFKTLKDLNPNTKWVKQEVKKEVKKGFFSKSISTIKGVFNPEKDKEPLKKEFNDWLTINNKTKSQDSMDIFIKEKDFK